MATPEVLIVRSKMLGLMIRDARSAAGKTQAECAEALGVPEATFAAYERGAQSISLPELEILACVLRVPLSHFWGDQIMTDDRDGKAPLHEVIGLRQRMIGVQLRQARLDAGLTQQDCAEALGCPVARIRAYESGHEPVPLPDLEVLADRLGLSLEALTTETGPIGEQLKALRAYASFNELPEDLRDFILESAKRGYLHLARRLSELPPAQLRALGEALIETIGAPSSSASGGE